MSRYTCPSPFAPIHVFSSKKQLPRPPQQFGDILRVEVYIPDEIQVYGWTPPCYLSFRSEKAAENGHVLRFVSIVAGGLVIEVSLYLSRKV